MLYDIWFSMRKPLIIIPRIAYAPANYYLQIHLLFKLTGLAKLVIIMQVNKLSQSFGKIQWGSNSRPEEGFCVLVSLAFAEVETYFWACLSFKIVNS